jgi:hypothetical protein
MFRRLTFALGFVAGLFGYVSLSAPAYASDVVYAGGGTLAQVVDGGGTHSIITLVNLDVVAASYVLYFYADNGQPLSLTTTAGTGAVLSGVLPIGGSTIIQTNGGGSTVLSGYAVLDTVSPSYDYQVGGSVVFGLPLANLPLAEASCPLDTGFDYIIGIPFDQTAASYGVALANSFGDGPYQYNSGQTANLAISFYDQSGNNFYSTTMQLPYGQHTSFMLNSQFTETAGKTGTMVITSMDTSAGAVSLCGSGGCPYVIKALGLRANNAGTTFTSVTPLIPCNYNSTYGCTN